MGYFAVTTSTVPVTMMTAAKIWRAVSCSKPRKPSAPENRQQRIARDQRFHPNDFPRFRAKKNERVEIISIAGVGIGGLRLSGLLAKHRGSLASANRPFL
jgi:hypothetical protein